VTILIAVTQRSAVLLAAGLLSIAAHFWHLKRAKESFINPELLKKPMYLKLLIVGFSIFVMNIGNLFLMPLALANLFGDSPLAIATIRFTSSTIFMGNNIRFSRLPPHLSLRRLV
jgi:DHA2 family metal-tetracycline-proton antiporter-like MFS transporter